MPLFGVLEDCREIVPELFGDASPSRLNVFDRRVAIRRFLCHRSIATRASVEIVPKVCARPVRDPTTVAVLR